MRVSYTLQLYTYTLTPKAVQPRRMWCCRNSYNVYHRAPYACGVPRPRDVTQYEGEEFCPTATAFGYEHTIEVRIPRAESESREPETREEGES